MRVRRSYGIKLKFQSGGWENIKKTLKNKGL